MKFKNAYDYIDSLYKAEKLIGLEYGLRGEQTIVGELGERDKEALNNIWMHHHQQYSGFYQLCYDSDNKLSFETTISEDIKDYESFPGDPNEIALIVIKTLNLKNIDIEDPLYYQIEVNLEIDFYNLDDSLYSLKKFEITTGYNETLKEELNSKLKENALAKIKDLIVNYLKEVHINKFSGYFDGFYLTLDETEAWEYIGTGSTSESLKLFLEDSKLNKYIKDLS